MIAGNTGWTVRLSLRSADMPPEGDLEECSRQRA